MAPPGRAGARRPPSVIGPGVGGPRRSRRSISTGLRQIKVHTANALWSDLARFVPLTLGRRAVPLFPLDPRRHAPCAHRPREPRLDARHHVAAPLVLVIGTASSLH